MARRIALDLMVNGTGTGTPFEWPGGDGVFTAEGTFGGGNVALQKMTRNGTWIPVINYATTTAIALTANGMANFRAANGLLRVVATTATAVYAYAVGVPSNTAG